MEGGEDAAFFELGTVAPFEVAGFELSAGGVEEDDRAGDFGGGDFIGNFPSLGNVVEDDFESEFFLQSENSEDVIVTVGVVVNDAFTIENVGEGFESEVAIEGFVGIVLGEVLGALFLVSLGVEETLANEGGGLAAGAGEGGVADGVGAVGHLDAAGEGAVGEFDGEVLHGVSVTEFEVERLTGHEVAGTGHEVDGGDASGAGFGDAGVTDVDGVEDADFGLDGRGTIGSGDLADVGVGADDTWDNGLSGAVNFLGIGRDLDLIGGTCGENGIASDEKGGVLDLR